MVSSGQSSIAFATTTSPCFQVATIVWNSNCRRDKLDLCLPDWVFQKIEAARIRLQS